VPRFLTEAWVGGFNASLEGVELPLPGPHAGLAAADGSFTVAEEVHGTPDGDVRLLLQADAGALILVLGTMDGTDEPVDVTISLGYDDAVALSTGDLSAAAALTLGRIKVRGDLSVLAAAQELLRAAHQHIQGFETDTTY
jgi:putative sterol carrier protein